MKSGCLCLCNLVNDNIVLTIVSLFQGDTDGNRQTFLAVITKHAKYMPVTILPISDFPINSNYR